MEVAADPSGIARDGARPATLASRSTESNASRLPPMLARKVAARTGPNPGMLSRIIGAVVLPEQLGDLGVDVGDVCIESADLLGQPDDQGRACGLGRQDGVLGVRGCHGLLGDLGTVPAAALPQPAGEPGQSHPPDALGGLVAAQEDQGRLLGVVERPLERREVLQQGGAEPVDRPDPVADQIRAAGGQQPQVHADLVGAADGLQIGAHPCLVGDDPGVFRVGLAITAVGRRGVVHDPSRDIEQLLRMRGQQLDQQRRAAGVQIRGPTDLATGRDLRDRG